MHKRIIKNHANSRISSHSPDNVLIIIIVLLVGFGLSILASASIIISQERFGSSYYYFFHQLIYGVGIGALLLFLVQRIHYKFWKKLAAILLILSIIALILVFVPGLGFGYGGAKRWVNLTIISFQPSELAKLGLIIYLAAWLEHRKESIKMFSKGVIPFLMILGLMGGLITAQPDIGTLGVIVAISIIMFYVGGARLSHILMIFFGGLATLTALIKLAPYRMNRLLAFFNPNIDPQGISYQIKQALLAIGSGGIFGLGLGHSRQKYSYLPSPAGDSIFAITAEELGFIGATVLILLFLGLALRGFKIAKNSPNEFAKLAAVGISSWFVVQAFINIAAITGLIPLTGITLPFVSYGASSMIISLIAAGILINISKYTT